MILSPVIDAFSLPSDALVERRIPKKLLIEQSEPTTSDKRYIQSEIDEICWVAAVKPTNVGVPAFRDATREYLEIAIVSVSLKSEAKAGRLIELVHRAIPYPVVLVATQSNMVCLSLSHKRWSQGEIGKTVIDGVRSTYWFAENAPTDIEVSFVQSTVFSELPRTNLFALYQGLLDRIDALQASQIISSFVLYDSVEQINARRSGLDNYARLKRELASLRAQAELEKQVSRLVNLNLEIKQLEADLEASKAML